MRVCDGVKTKDGQNSTANVFSSSKLKSQLNAKLSQMNKTDLALLPYPAPSKSIYQMSVFMPPETILLYAWVYFYLLYLGSLSKC